MLAVMFQNQFPQVSIMERFACGCLDTTNSISEPQLEVFFCFTFGCERVAVFALRGPLLDSILVIPRDVPVPISRRFSLACMLWLIHRTIAVLSAFHGVLHFLFGASGLEPVHRFP